MVGGLILLRDFVGNLVYCIFGVSLFFELSNIKRFILIICLVVFILSLMLEYRWIVYIIVLEKLSVNVSVNLVRVVLIFGVSRIKFVIKDEKIEFMRVMCKFIYWLKS